MYEGYRILILRAILTDPIQERPRIGGRAITYPYQRTVSPGTMAAIRMARTGGLIASFA
jgi:hypothetical protein